MATFTPSAGDFGKVVQVTSRSDLPAAVAGVISTDADTAYEILNDVDITPDRIDPSAGRALFYGPGGGIVTIQTANAAALFTSTSQISLRNLSLANPAGPCLAFGGGAPTFVDLENCLIFSAADDTFTGGIACGIRNTRWVGGSAGVVFSGAWIVGFFLDRMGFLQITGTPTLVTMAAGMTADVIDITGGGYIMSAGQTGLDIDVGILPTLRGQITGSFFSSAGLAFAVGGVDQTTIGWAFRNNPGIEDSASIGDILFDGNATVTTINTQNVYETIATGVAWALGAASERFSVVGAALRYMGVEDIRVQVSVVVRVEGASNNTTFQVRLLKGAVEVDAFLVDFRLTPLTVPKQAVLSLSENDDLTIEIRNIDSNTNVTVISAQILATKAG